MKKIFLFFLLGGFAFSIFAQDEEQEVKGIPVTTSLPFLLIAPDAVSSAMGDAGVSSMPNAASMHWNPAKYAFIEENLGLMVSYSPWLRQVADDMGLAYLSGFYRLDEMQTVGFALRYFSLGEIDFYGNSSEDHLGTFSPNEFSIDLAYARKLSDNFSMSVAGRYIRSDLTKGISTDPGANTQPANSVAADISLYYQKEIFSNNLNGVFAFGANISNIGAKITYTNSTAKDFLPTNLRLGPSFRFDLDDYNQLGIHVDVNKLLVPSKSFDEDGNDKTADISALSGIFQSFSDAPGGFKEELKEFYYSVGAEYWYDQQFAVRAGYFYENPDKGDRHYFTLGAGLRYNAFGLDFSYLLPAGDKGALDNTLRFSLKFDIGS